MDRADVSSIVAWSQSLSQISMAVLGATIALLLGTGHRRPTSLLIRSTYLLFLPGWWCLFASLIWGSNVSRQYRAYLLSGERNDRWLKTFLMEDCVNQEWWFQYALLFFAAWLFAYVVSWIFAGRHLGVPTES